MNVFFNPRIGSEYDRDPKRIMILGDSHYCKEATIFNNCNKCTANKNCEQWTINGLNEIINRENYNRSHNTYIKFEKAFLGIPHPTDEQRKKMWDSLIMYNYVQTAVAKPRKSPSKEMFKLSEDAFWEILNKYKPNYVIVWGRRLWHHFPKKLQDESSIKKFELAETTEYTYDNNKKVRFISIDHPSGSFTIERWKERLRLFLKP